MATANIQGWIDQMPAWRRAIVAMAAGAVGALAFAPFFVAPAYAVTMCAAIWLLDGAATRKRRSLSGFARGFWLGLGHFLAGTYWVGAAFTQIDGAEALAPVGVLGLAVILAVFWGGAGAVAVRFWTEDFHRIPAFAAALFGFEMLRAHLFGGFPWNLAGYVWEAGGAISQLAAFVGIYGLTALTILLMAAPAALADQNARWGARAAPLLVASLLWGLCWGAGAQRLEAAGPPSARGQGPVVRVVDPGLTQREKWEPGREWEVAARYLALSGTTDTSDSLIVVWPEGAIPVRGQVMPMLDRNQELVDAIGRTLGDRVMIVGATRMDEGPPPTFYNSAYVIDAVGGQTEFGQVRDKHRLTPFGEFIPLFEWVSWLPIPTLQQIGSGFTAGDPPARMIVPGADSVLVLICYESIFPGIIPRGAERPGWIANISIDAWYGEGTGPYQNDNQSRYRAIEEGLPMARAASGGVSGIIDAFGRRIVWMGREGGAVEAPLPPALAPTFYARAAPAIIPVFLLLLLMLRFTPLIGPGGRIKS
jgi:apolipoprotein N-acyltransferase